MNVKCFLRAALALLAGICHAGAADTFSWKTPPWAASAGSALELVFNYGSG